MMGNLEKAPASPGIMPTEPVSGWRADPRLDAGPVDGARFRLGMRRLASGVSLVTTELDGIPRGLIATSVSSLTDEPPTLIVCVNRSASGHAPLCEARRMCVNVLAVTHREIASQFSNSHRRGERFKSGSWTTMTTGAPVLEDAIASFDCRIEQVIDYATHSIFVGLVLDARAPEGAQKPMIYFNRGFTEPSD